MFGCSPKPSNKDTERTSILVSSGIELMKMKQWDSALAKFKEAEQGEFTSERLAVIYNSKGYIYDELEDYPKAIESYINAVTLFKAENNKSSTVQAQINAAVSFKKMEMYDKTVEYCKTAEQGLNQSNSRQREKAVIYNLLGNTYKELKNYPMAMEYHQKSMDIRRDTSTNLSIAPAINNLGNVYYDMEDYNKALDFFVSYRNLAIAGKSQKKLARAYENMSKTYLKLQELKKAKVCLDSSKQLFSKLNYQTGLLSLHLISSDFNFTIDITKSEYEAEKALLLAAKIDKPHQKLEALKRLQDINETQRKYSEALKYSLSYQRLKDSINDFQKLGQIYAFEMLNRVEQKNSIIEKEQQKRKLRTTQVIFMILIAISLMIVCYLLYQRYINKQKFIDEYFSSDTGVILRSGQLIKFEDILKVETLRNDLFIHTIQGLKFEQKNTTLKAFIPNLPKIQFGRPQRGIVVNFNFITKVWKTKLDLLQESINISTTYGEQFHMSWDEFKKVKGIE